MKPARWLGRLSLVLGLSALGTFVLSGGVRGQEHDGEDMNVHNKTGHTVTVFLFADDNVHTDEAGGTQVADLQDGESAVAHVANCTFSILLVDGDDLWHAEFHDCHSTDLTFTADTGHTHRNQ